MGQSGSKNPQPLASASGGGAGNSGNDGPLENMIKPQLEAGMLELRARLQEGFQETQNYVHTESDRQLQASRRIETSEANLAELQVRVAVLESAGIQNSDPFWKFAGYLTILFLGYQAWEGATNLASRYIKTRWCTPTLVYETSRLSCQEVIFQPITSIQKLKNPFRGRINAILAPSIEQQLRDLTAVVRECKENSGEYLTVLLQGPVGTGKTMSALKLAEDLGMDYAITNGDFFFQTRGENSGRYKEYGVSGINQIFDWASTSKGGLLLLVNGADRLLAEESIKYNSEDLHKTFVRRTREHSRKVMVVLATTAEQPVWLGGYQVDKTVKFELPGVEERKRIFEFYVKRDVPWIAATENKSYDVEMLNDEGLYLEMAKMSEGFSAFRLKNFAFFAACSAVEDGVFREEAIKACQRDVNRWREMEASYKAAEEKRARESRGLNTDAPEVPPNGAGGNPEGIPTA